MNDLVISISTGMETQLLCFLSSFLRGLLFYSEIVDEQMVSLSLSN